MPLHPHEHLFAAAKSARADEAVKLYKYHRMYTNVYGTWSKVNFSYSSVRETSTNNALPSTANTVADSNGERETERDVYATKLRAAMERKEQNIVTELG